MPLTREWKQSSRRPAPKDCETRVSRPMRTPSRKRAKTRNRLELMLTAAMDCALLERRPTIMVSTIAMLIHPISARTSGRARCRVGRSSERSVGQKGMGNRKVYGGRRREVKEEAEKKGMPSKLVVGSKLCRGPSTPSREGRGSPVGMASFGGSKGWRHEGRRYREATDEGGEVTGWGNDGGSSIDGGMRRRYGGMQRRCVCWLEIEMERCFAMGWRKGRAMSIFGPEFG